MPLSPTLLVAAAALASTLLLASAQSPSLSVSPKDLRILVDRNGTFELNIRNFPRSEVVLSVNHDDLLFVSPKLIYVAGDRDETHEITVLGLDAGHAAASADATLDVGNFSTFVTVTIQHNSAAYYVSVVVGWVYFVAWSVSFYPQIYENWKRKSVVGLNFDFLALNLVGFICYSLFNCGLYWIPVIRDQYSDRFPKGHNPVMVNDIVFALHALFAIILTIIQCIFFERGNQKVSRVAKGILILFGVFLEISYFLAGINVIIWLEFLNFCSYVKLATTLIKYIPQAYMNYKRKSTVGWSIGNIILDFTGGMLSMLQMILNSYNYNDWESIFGDPTKFGLGLFSVIFDILFIIQHYVLYRHGSGVKDSGQDSPSGVSATAPPSTTDSDADLTKASLE